MEAEDSRRVGIVDGLIMIKNKPPNMRTDAPCGLMIVHSSVRIRIKIRFDGIPPTIPVRASGTFANQYRVGESVRNVCKSSRPIRKGFSVSIVLCFTPWSEFHGTQISTTRHCDIVIYARDCLVIASRSCPNILRWCRAVIVLKNAGNNRVLNACGRADE